MNFIVGEFWPCSKTGKVFIIKETYKMGNNNSDFFKLACRVESHDKSARNKTMGAIVSVSREGVAKNLCASSLIGCVQLGYNNSYVCRVRTVDLGQGLNRYRNKLVEVLKNTILLTAINGPFAPAPNKEILLRFTYYEEENQSYNLCLNVV